MEKNTIKTWHAFLINPAAGPESCEGEIRRGINGYFHHSKSNKITIFASKYKGDVVKEIHNLYEAVIKEGFQELLLYACGGDGMLSEVVNGVMKLENHDRIAITHIPKGFENDFVRNFSNPGAFSDMGLFGSRKNIREFNVDVLKVNDRYCINSCSFGLDARIEYRAQELRKKRRIPEKLIYPASTAIELAKNIKTHMCVTVRNAQGKSSNVDGDYMLACFCNGGWIEGRLHPIPQAEINDGAIDLLTIRKIGRMKVLSLLKECKVGRYEQVRDFADEYHIVHAKVITYQLEPVCIDGDVYWFGDTTIDVIPKALKFFAPKSTWIH